MWEIKEVRDLLKKLEAKIQETYEQGVTLEQAERLAAEFLAAQIQVSDALKKADLDSRMKKSGVKAIRAALYLDTAQTSEKKPTEAAIEATLNSNELVIGEQRLLDEAEVSKSELERYYDIFSNAHIYYRGVSKGRFD